MEGHGMLMLIFFFFFLSQGTSVDLDSVTRSLKSFVDNVSSYEGAEFPG